MMKRRSLGLMVAMIAGGILLATPTRAYADLMDFSPSPGSGAVAGAPGSTVGWGYSLTNNDSTNWFVTILLNADSFGNGTPSALFDFPSVAPGATASVPYNPGTAGLYELTWDSGAPVGFVNSGNFVLSGQWWDGDPFGGGNFLFDALDISVAYSATVTDGGLAPVPEPLSLWLLVTACLATAGCSIRTRKRSSP